MAHGISIISRHFDCYSSSRQLFFFVKSYQEKWCTFGKIAFFFYRRRVSKQKSSAISQIRWPLGMQQMYEFDATESRRERTMHKNFVLWEINAKKRLKRREAFEACCWNTTQSSHCLLPRSMLKLNVFFFAKTCIMQGFSIHLQLLFVAAQHKKRALVFKHKNDQRAPQSLSTHDDEIQHP